MRTRQLRIPLPYGTNCPRGGDHEFLPKQILQRRLFRRSLLITASVCRKCGKGGRK